MLHSPSNDLKPCASCAGAGLLPVCLKEQANDLVRAGKYEEANVKYQEGLEALREGVSWCFLHSL